MVDVHKLRGIIAERGFSQRKIAEAIGMNEKTFYRKMAAGVFGSDEIDSMIRILGIKTPSEMCDIFFPVK